MKAFIIERKNLILLKLSEYLFYRTPLRGCFWSTEMLGALRESDLLETTPSFRQIRNAGGRWQVAGSRSQVPSVR